MAIYRVKRTRDYTVMSNHHLKDRELSLKAKGLLSMILSLPDEWNYTLHGLAAISKEGVDAIGSAVRELEKAGYVIRRQLRGANGRISDTEYTIYEQPYKSDVEVSNLNEPHMGNPDMVEPAAETTAELNMQEETTQRENTNRVNTEGSNTHSFSRSVGDAERQEKKTARRTDGLREIQALRDRIRERIGYAYIANAENRQQVDELVELMLEVGLTKSPVIKLGRDMEYPAAYVQERFGKIGQLHIEKVLAGIEENVTQVKNTRAYLLATLFNAPSTLDNHYIMQVNHDFQVEV